MWREFLFNFLLLQKSEIKEFKSFLKCFEKLVILEFFKPKVRNVKEIEVEVCLCDFM